MISPYIDMTLLALILFLSMVLVFAIDYMRSTIIVALISVLAATTYLVMLAPDVALTEAAVGACASTCIILISIRLLSPTANLFSTTKKQLMISGLACCIMFIAMCYCSIDLHQYGDPSAIIKDGVSRHYILNIERDIGMRSLVTGILASYRGMDTLCETLVIFTAGISVFFIFGYSILNNKTK
ncbi:MAG: DUF4040 domain-containing protein [Rickettsiales bacterium]|nr:DUF4040 domain-containing protein [Rickettsiales bacterium]